MLGFGDDQIAASTDDANAFLFDERFVRQGIVGVDLDHAVLGLRHDLLGHDEDVAIGQGTVGCFAARVDDDVTELVARFDLADAGDAPRGESNLRLVGHHRPFSRTAASVTRARSPATPGVDMIVSVTMQRTPSASTAAARWASLVSITSVPQTGA